MAAEWEWGAWPDCCPCECSCTNCANDSAPCCWKIVISDMAEGTCGSCASLDGTYYVYQSGDDNCLWLNRCEPTVCDPESIQLQVVQESGDYIIRVTMGGHIWEKNYGASKPTCCGMLSESLTHTTSSGNCDSSSATCVISHEGSYCLTNCCNTICADDQAPDALEITLNGIANVICDFCTCFNRTFVLVYEASCTWRANWACEPCTYDYLDAKLLDLSGHYYLVIGFTIWPATLSRGNALWEYDFGTEKPECLSWSSLSADRTANPWPLGKCSCSDPAVFSSAQGMAGTVDWDTAGHPNQTYEPCLCRRIPDEIRVTCSGFTGSLSVLNGVYILPHCIACGSACDARYRISTGQAYPYDYLHVWITWDTDYGDPFCILAGFDQFNPESGPCFASLNLGSARVNCLTLAHTISNGGGSCGSYYVESL